MGTRLSKAYLLTKVMTANNNEVIVYLYEGMISYLQRAKIALREDRRAEAGLAIERTINILIALSSSLNYTAGGHLAGRLDGLYNYLIQSLVLANRRADVEALEASEGIVVMLHDAWRQAAASVDSQATVRTERQLRISA